MAPEEQDAAIDAAMQDLRLARLYASYRRHLFGQVHFLKNSGRYTLYAKGNLGKGDFNVYRNFVETALRNARPGGFAAQVAPSGLYGGANASAIRHHLLDECDLRLVVGCENGGQSFFPGVHPQTWFCIYSAQRGGRTEQVLLAFGIDSPRLLPLAPERRMAVPASLIRKQAPDTYAIPDLRSALEMTIAAKLSAAHPAFGDADAGPPIRHYESPWV